MHRVLGIGHWLLSTSLRCPHPNTHTLYCFFFILFCVQHCAPTATQAAHPT